MKCLETQYGLHPGDYTVISAKLPWNNSLANLHSCFACMHLCGVLTVYIAFKSFVYLCVIMEAKPYVDLHDCVCLCQVVYSAFLQDKSDL